MIRKIKKVMCFLLVRLLLSMLRREIDWIAIYLDNKLASSLIAKSVT